MAAWRSSKAACEATGDGDPSSSRDRPIISQQNRASLATSAYSRPAAYVNVPLGASNALKLALLHHSLQAFPAFYSHGVYSNRSDKYSCRQRRPIRKRS